MAVEFADPADYNRIEQGDVLRMDGHFEALGRSHEPALTRDDELVVDVTLSPRMASVDVEAGALRSPIRLLNAVTVVPPDKSIPLTIGAVLVTALSLRS